MQPTPRQKQLQNALFFVGLQSGTVSSPSSASETYSLRTKQEDVFYKINHIFVGRTVQPCKFRLFVPCVIPAHEAISGNCAWFIPIRRWHRRHSRWQIFTGASRRLEPVIKCCSFLSFFQCLVSRAPLSAVTESLS